MRLDEFSFSTTTLGGWVKFVVDDTDVKLLGFCFGAMLVFVIIFGVELFNGPPPEHSTLHLFTGQMVDARISKSRERIYADIQVRSGPNTLIFFQQVPEELASKIMQSRSGAAVSVLFFGKEFTDQKTGLPRHAMWQLSVDGKEMFSYDEILQFQVNQTAPSRILGYGSAAVGIACLVAIVIRRRRRATP